jgi:hypothetical protein
LPSPPDLPFEDCANAAPLAVAVERSTTVHSPIFIPPPEK